MKVVVFANNRVGLRGLEILRADPDTTVVGLVVHPPERRRYGDEILAASGLPPERVLTADRLKKDPDALDALRSFGAEMGVSLLYGYILPKAVLDLFARGCVNLHPSMLPYNRGANTNVWAIVDRTPAGATLHLLDPGVDTGPILAQREVPVLPTDTGASLYHRQEEACLELLRASWPRLLRGELQPKPQAPGSGTYHRLRDTEKIDRLELDETYTARDLVDRIRARTFPPFKGCYFDQDGRRVYLRLTLWCDDDPGPDDA